MALENEIKPIHVCSVEWSNRSVTVQKRTFWSLCSLKNVSRFATARAHAGQSDSTQSIDKVFHCMASGIVKYSLMREPVHNFLI